MTPGTVSREGGGEDGKEMHTINQLVLSRLKDILSTPNQGCRGAITHAGGGAGRGRTQTLIGGGLGTMLRPIYPYYFCSFKGPSSTGTSQCRCNDKFIHHNGGSCPEELAISFQNMGEQRKQPKSPEWVKTCGMPILDKSTLPQCQPITSQHLNSRAEGWHCFFIDSTILHILSLCILQNCSYSPTYAAHPHCLRALQGRDHAYRCVSVVPCILGS